MSEAMQTQISALLNPSEAARFLMLSNNLSFVKLHYLWKRSKLETMMKAYGVIWPADLKNYCRTGEAGSACQCDTRCLFVMKQAFGGNTLNLVKVFVQTSRIISSFTQDLR